MYMHAGEYPFVNFTVFEWEPAATTVCHDVSSQWGNPYYLFYHFLNIFICVWINLSYRLPSEGLFCILHGVSVGLFFWLPTSMLSRPLFIWLSFFILSLSPPLLYFCLECAFDIHFSAFCIGGNFGGKWLALYFHWRCMSIENRSDE